MLADFAFPAGLNLTASWKTLFRNLAVALAIAFGVGIVSFNGKVCLLALGLFVTACHALGVVCLTGHVFQRNFCSGVNLPIYAGFGLGFRELSRMLLKYSAVQLPFLLVFGVAAGLAAGLLTGLPVGYTLIIGFKTGILLFAARYILLAMAFSGITSKSRRFFWRSLAAFFGIVALAVAFASFAGCGLFLSDPAVAWLLFAAALAIAYAFFRAYEWYYYRGRLDLMSLPPRQ